MSAKQARRRLLRTVVLPLALGQFIASQPIVPAAAADRAPTVTPKNDPYGEFITEAAERFQLPERWIRVVIHTESDGNPRARSPKGAMGLMQIMPQTWNELHDLHRLGDDPFDPHDNIIAGTAYLRSLYDRFGAPGFLSAYNAGPGRYDDHLKTGRTLPSEATAYVAAIARRLDETASSEQPAPGWQEVPEWTSAPLFAGKGNGNPTADHPATEQNLDGKPAALAARDVSAITPQSTGLFVARPGEGATR